jgi:hypothetical protein
MACNLPSLTNGKVDSIVGRDLELIVGTEKAKDLLAYLATPEFIDIFGDYHKEFSISETTDPLFKGRITPETGEPKLFKDERLNKSFFLDKHNERVYYPYERVGLNGIFTTNETKELTESLALMFAKLNNLKIDLDTLNFESADTPLSEMVEVQLFALIHKLDQSDEIADMDNADKLNDSLEHLDEWKELVKQYFAATQINLVESETEESDRMDDEAIESKGSGARVESFLKSHRTNMLSNVKMFLSLIEDTRKNSFGLYKFVPFDNIYSTLFKELSNMTAIELHKKDGNQVYENLYDVYLEKIKSLVVVKPFLQNLVDKLEDPTVATDMFKNQFVSAFYLFKKNFLGSEFTISEDGKVTYSIMNLSETGSRQSNIITSWYDNFIKQYSDDKLLSNIEKLKSWNEAFNLGWKTYEEEDMPNVLKTARNLLAGIGITTSPEAFDYYLNNNSIEEQPFTEKLKKISNLLNNRIYKRVILPFLDENQRESLFSSNIFKAQSGELGKLAKAEAFFMEESSDASIFTLGKTKWAYSNPSFLDLKFGEWKRNPDALLAHYKSEKFNKNSKVIQYLLGMSKANNFRYTKKVAKERLAAVEIGVFNSLQEGGDSINASESDTISYTDSLVDHIHKTLGSFGRTSTKSWWKTALAADKSTEYQINYGIDLIQANVGYVNGEYQIDDAALDILLGYFLDEYARMNEVAHDLTQSLVNDSIELIPNKHLGNKNGLKSQIFPELSPKFEEGLLPEIPDTGLSYNLFTEDGHPAYKRLSAAKKQEFKDKYVKPKILQRIKDFNEILLKENIIAYDKEGVLTNNSIDSGIFDFYEESTNKNVSKAGLKLAGDIIVNGIISQVEYAKMFTGDLAYYKTMVDYRKRVPATYTDGLYLNVFNEEDLHFNISVVESVEIDEPSVKYLKEYTSEDVWKQYENKSVDSTDAQAWITPKRWKFLMDKMGKWTPAHDGVWAEMQKKVPMFDAAQRKLVAQPMKGVYFDVQKGRPIFLKYSQAVLVPNLVRNIPTLSRLLTKMQNQNIDELITSSGIKVGQHVPTKIHNEQGELLEDFTLKTLQLNNKFWKLQQDLPTKGIKLTDVGSQIQKNIFQALVFNQEDTFTLDDGTSHTGDTMINYLNDLTTAMLYKNKSKVYKELGIDEETGKITNEDALYDRIIEQLEKRRDVPKNLLNGLRMGTSPFGIPGATELFQNVFSSIINNDLNKIKTNGGGFIQMADFGLTKNEAANKGVKFTPWFLESRDNRATMPQIAKDKSGKDIIDPITGKRKLIPAGIFIPGNLISKYIPNYQKFTSTELFGRFNEKTGRYTGGKIDQEVLENIIGYRIPNQGLVSNDAFRVVGILPEGMGDAVIAYAGITKKTGSDFDIDKLYLMTPSVEYIGEKIKYIQSKKENGEELPMEEQSMGALRNMLINAYKNILLQGDEAIMDKVFRPLDMDFFQSDIDNLNKAKDIKAFDNFDVISDIETKIKFKTSKAGLGVAVNNTMDYVRSAMGDMKLASNLGWGNIEKGLSVLDREKSEELSNDDLNNYIEDYNKRVSKDNEITKEQAKKFKSDFKSISIGDSFMALTNAFVDVANNPFIVEGNWVNQTNNLGFMLIRAGVHPFKVNAFLNQPIIKDYVAYKNNVESKTVSSARNPIMSFKLRKIADGLPRDEDATALITIGGRTLSPRRLFYSLIESLSSIEYIHKSNVDPKDQTAVEKLKEFEQAMESFKDGLKGAIATRFKVSQAIKQDKILEAEVVNITDQLTKAIEDVLFIDPVKFEDIDFLTMRKQNATEQMDIAVQESMLAKYLEWTKLSKSLSKSVTASRTDVEGKGKNIASLIISVNKLRQVMTDNKLIGFGTKYERNNKRTGLGSNTDLTLYNMDKVMLANPKFFAPYRKSVIQTFNSMSNAIKGDLLVNDKLANSLLRSYTSYLLSGFSPFQLSDKEKNNVIDETPKIVKRLQKAYPENALLQELYLREAGEIRDDNGEAISKVFQVGISNAKKTASVKDNITDGFRDLLEVAPEEAEKLIKYAFLTSGGVKTLTDFFEYIPYEWFNRNRFNQYLNDVINRDSREKGSAAMDVTFANQYMRHFLNDKFVVENRSIYGKSAKTPTGASKYKLGYQSVFMTTRASDNHPPFITTTEEFLSPMGDVTAVSKIHYYKLAVRNKQAIYVRTTPLGLKHKTGTKILEFDITKDGSLAPLSLSAFEANNTPIDVPFPRATVLQYIKDNPDNLDYSTGAFGSISDLDEHSLEKIEELLPTPNTTTKKVVETITENVNKPIPKILMEVREELKEVDKSLDMSEKSRILEENNDIDMNFYNVTFGQPYREDAELASLGAYNTRDGIRVRPDITVEEFMEHITGKGAGIGSGQKKVVFDSLVTDFGYDLVEVKKLFKTAADIKAFIIYHEISHLEHQDNIIGTKERKEFKKKLEDENKKLFPGGLSIQELEEKFATERHFLPEVIKFETRATIDAFNMLKLVQDKYAKHLKESKELSTGQTEDDMREDSYDTPQEPRWGMTPQSFKEYIQDLGDSNQLGFDFSNNPCK